MAWIYDGDSLRLEDGRKVRLIGLDTPELGRHGTPDAPGAEAARRRLRALVESQDERLLLELGRDYQDRYGRFLAHLYLPNGRNLSRQLLMEGLGIAVVIPPNFRHSDCYFDAEKLARAARRGLWSADPVVVSADLPAQAEGFHVVRGRVVRVAARRHSLWLNLEGGLALRLDRSDLQYFPGLDLDALKGRALEVRGWIYRRNGQRRMQLRHPASLRWLDD